MYQEVGTVVLPSPGVAPRVDLSPNYRPMLFGKQKKMELRTSVRPFSPETRNTFPQDLEGLNEGQKAMVNDMQHEIEELKTKASEESFQQGQLLNVVQELREQLESGRILRTQAETTIVKKESELNALKQSSATSLETIVQLQKDVTTLFARGNAMEKETDLLKTKCEKHQTEAEQANDKVQRLQQKLLLEEGQRKELELKWQLLEETTERLNNDNRQLKEEMRWTEDDKHHDQDKEKDVNEMKEQLKALQNERERLCDKIVCMTEEMLQERAQNKVRMKEEIRRKETELKEWYEARIAEAKQDEARNLTDILRKKQKKWNEERKELRATIAFAQSSLLAEARKKDSIPAISPQHDRGPSPNLKKDPQKEREEQRKAENNSPGTTRYLPDHDMTSYGQKKEKAEEESRRSNDKKDGTDDPIRRLPRLSLTNKEGIAGTTYDVEERGSLWTKTKIEGEELEEVMALQMEGLRQALQQSEEEREKAVEAAREANTSLQRVRERLEVTEAEGLRLAAEKLAAERRAEAIQAELRKASEELGRKELQWQKQKEALQSLYRKELEEQQHRSQLLEQQVAQWHQREARFEEMLDDQLAEERERVRREEEALREEAMQSLRRRFEQMLTEQLEEAEKRQLEERQKEAVRWQQKLEETERRSFEWQQRLEEAEKRIETTQQEREARAPITELQHGENEQEIEERANEHSREEEDEDEEAELGELTGEAYKDEQEQEHEYQEQEEHRQKEEEQAEEYYQERGGETDGDEGEQDEERRIVSEEIDDADNNRCQTSNEAQEPEDERVNGEKCSNAGDMEINEKRETNGLSNAYGKDREKEVEITRLQEMIEDRERQLRENERQMDELHWLKSENECLEKRLTEMRDMFSCQLEEQEDILLRTKNEVDSLRKSLLEKEALLREVEQQQKDEEKEKQDNKLEAENEDEEILETQKPSKKEVENPELQKAIQTELHRRTLELEEAVKQRKATQSQLDALQRQHNRLLSMLDDKETELNVLRQNMQDIAQSMLFSKDNNSEDSEKALRKELEGLKEKLIEKEQELDLSKTALEEEQKRMEAVVMEMAELEQERLIRQAEQKPPKEQESGSQRREELEEKVTDLQHKLREKEELIFGLKQELSLLQQQQQDNNNSCSSSDVSESQPLVERIRELEREIAANAEDQQLREQEVVALREMNIAQEQEVRTLETVIKANEEEFMTTRRKYKATRMERDQMQAQLNICKRQLQMAEDKFKVMRSHQKRLEQKVKQDMKGDTEHLKAELKKKEAQVEDLLMEVQVWKFSCEESEREKAKEKEKERNGGLKEEERQWLLRLLEEKEVELMESKRGRTEMEGLLSTALKEARQEARERAAEALALKQSIQQHTQQHALTSMQESNNEDEEEIFRWSDSEEEAEKETENGNGTEDFYLMKEREWEQIRQSAVTKEIEMDQVIDELRTKLEQAQETILEKESELMQIRIELQNREEEKKELDRLKEELHFTRNRPLEFETTIVSNDDEGSTPITPTTDLLEAKRRTSEVSVSAMERSLAEAQERMRVLERNLEAAQNTTAEKEVSLVLAMETEKEWQSRVRTEQVRREKVETELMAVSKEVQQLKKLVVERDDAVNMLQEVNEEMERNFEEVERQHETWRSEQEEQEKQRKEEVERLRLELDTKQKEVDELRASLQQAKEKEIIALRERTNEMEPDEEEKNAARRNEEEIKERILRLEISGIEKQNALEQLEKLLATALEEKEQQWRENEQQVLALTERLQSLLQETDKLHCQVNQQTIELAETRFELERKESIISQLESQLQQFVKVREAEDDGESEERTEEEKVKQLETELQRKQTQLEMFQRWELEHSAELLDKEHREITDLTGFYETKLKEHEELLRQQKLALEEAARHSSDLRLEIEILEVTNREKSEELVEKEKEVERLKVELEEALRQLEKSDEQDLSTSSSFSSFFQKEDEEELTSMLDISAASSIASFFGTAETEASNLDDEKEGVSEHEEVTEKEENGAAPPEKQITTGTNAEYENISTKEEGHEKQKEEEQEKGEETEIEANDEEEKDVSKLLHRLYRQRLEEEERSLQAQITVQRNMLEFFTGLGKLAGREGELAELKELLCEKERKLRQVRASLLELKRDIAARLKERERELEERERAVESLLLLRLQHSESEKEKDKGAEQRKQDQELEGGEDRPKRQPTKEEEQEKEDEDEVNSLMEPMREEERVTMLEARNQKQEGANKNEVCSTPPQHFETTQKTEDTFEELNTSREEIEERRHREDDEEKEEADVGIDEEDDEEPEDEEEEEDMEASKWSKREMSEIMQVQREEIVELRSMLRIRERKFQSLVEELQQARCKLEALQSAPREQEEAEEDERSNKNKDDDDEETEAKREGLNMNAHALIEELKREREKHALTMQTLEQLRMKQLIKEEERDDVHDSENKETEKEESRRQRKEEARSLLRSVLVKEERAAEWVGSKVNALVDHLLRVDNDDEKEGMKEKEEKEEDEEEEKTEQRLRLIQDDILQLQTELQQNRLALLEEDKAKEDVEKKKGEEELETKLEKQVSEQMSYFFFMSRVTQDLAELFLLHHHQQQAKLRKQQLQQQNNQAERNKQRSARNEKQKRKMGDEERTNSWQSESGENGGESVEEAETIINGHLATEETTTKKKGKTKKKRKKQFHHEQSMELASTAEATIDAMIERLQSSILSSFALSSPFDSFHGSPLPDTRGVLENDGEAMEENGKKDEAEWSNILRQQQQQEEEERWKKKEHIVSSLALLDDGNGAITSDEDDDEDLIEDYFYVKSDDDEESG
ncbi:hypothetical protein QOT17_012756 [Balamuthia mandrillaris]